MELPNIKWIISVMFLSTTNKYIYETPEILRSIFSTASCLQSDNGVSTSNKGDKSVATRRCGST